ncbi:hypothetical protein FNV43_RR00043 [Rhamnella rubrinervis]|uniref:Methyltransferase n=1 Tax=Rhamnella rubrinervis TaxID=2594499 RepID=A0A8K0HNT6_9ROSA|nr:hypothetical protein FNV43_RR00043 [Rhamnella rubrinervis]
MTQQKRIDSQLGRPFRRSGIGRRPAREYGVWSQRRQGGGTSFRQGVKGYVEEIKKVLPLTSGSIRTVLDVGCGVASFGASLMDYNILTMSIAPRDKHVAQVQLALERGLPAMLGVLSTHRLPYPSRSFDMVHCFRCLVPWTKYESGTIAVWRKPTNHIHCIQKLKLWKSTRLCVGSDPDASWYKKMETCITPLLNVTDIHAISGGALGKWPKRLMTTPPRIKSDRIKGITANTFNEDIKFFAAALMKFPAWVMNVVPYNAKENTLGVVFERGLIGTYMDWCEPFSTYPRTYDLIHAYNLFSMYKDKCDIVDILLEMHWIFCRHGSAIIRDHVGIIVKVKGIADKIRWNAKIFHSGPFHPEKILLVDNSDE